MRRWFYAGPFDTLAHFLAGDAVPDPLTDTSIWGTVIFELEFGDAIEFEFITGLFLSVMPTTPQ